eukprot:TRINITY_DN25886_c0_g1_i1.p1 TRINITY_DN25886_c0_g1~~TRINITY_DN25886_c0_g1_i1.p1  ORF type:complete len:262 (+),score=53.63 TRINITY_DN25886_c0_g1_i1:42-827(+)
MSEDETAALRKENKLLTRLSVEGERESRVYKAEIERLRNELAKYEKSNRHASVGCQTFTVYIEDKGEGDLLREELPLLRKQTEEDHIRLAEMATSLNTVTHERDMARKQLQRSLKEISRLTTEQERLEIAYRAETHLLDNAKEHISQLADQLDALNADNSSLSNQDWRQFWERKSLITSRSREAAAQLAVAAAVSLLMIGSEMVVFVDPPSPEPIDEGDVCLPVATLGDSFNATRTSSSPFQTIKQLRAAAKERQADACCL